jgi:hypothetical protein
MNCDETSELIQLYMDNELDARSTLRVRDHLEICPRCAGLLDAYVRQDSLLREEAKREIVSSEALRRSVIETIGSESVRPAKRWFRRSWLRAAAIAIVLGPALLYLFTPDIFLPGASVCALAASDHANHCSLESRWKGITDEQELSALAWSYGLAGGVPDLSNLGFGQPCGRICRLHDSRYLHIVYYTSGEEPLSVFARSSDSAPRDLDLILRVQRGYSVAIASGSGRELLVVTSRDENSAQVIAREAWTKASLPKNAKVRTDNPATQYGTGAIMNGTWVRMKGGLLLTPRFIEVLTGGRILS